MTMRFSKRIMSFILSTMLIVAIACSMTGCGGNNTESPKTETEGQSEAGSTEGDVQDDTGSQDVVDKTVLGEGATVFAFVVVDGEGNEKTFEIHTDKTTVGAALLELELIEGEDGPYGLYVKSVNGTTLDYNKDGMYWSFYINDEYAMTGVDKTDITEGATYSFKVEK